MMSEISHVEGPDGTTTMLRPMRINGGPLDDRAFVVGVQYGMIRTAFLLAPRGVPLVWSGLAYSELRDQLELLAMETGADFASNEVGMDGWVHVHLERGAG